MRRIWCLFLFTFPSLLAAAAAFSRAQPVWLQETRICVVKCCRVSLHAARRRSWEESYELLLSYKEEHGHTNVPQSERPLGTWVNSQRIEHAKYLRWIEKEDNEDNTELSKTSMNSRRKKLLDDVDFVWDAVGHTWITRYEELCEFRRKHGHCVVPRSCRLGAWVEKMRIEYKKYNTLLSKENSKNSKIKTILTQDRVQKLSDIDFVWNVREKQFEQNLGELRLYKEMNGHIDPRFMNGKLALWVRRMEREYRLYLQATSEEEESAVMSTQRRLALESAGFSVSMFDEPRSRSTMKPRATWEERFEELKEYKKVNGDCVVPKNYGPLGSWVRSQRHLRKEQGTVGVSFEGGSHLSQDRVDRLDKLGFVWDVHQYQWNQTYHELLSYKNEHGDCNVPMSYGGLGLWVFNQRAHYNSFRRGQSSHMTESRLQMLEAIGFAFDLGQRISSAADERWRNRLKELKEYFEKWGTLNVKQSRNPSLYNWCQRQKACYRAKLEGKKSPLTVEREDALRSIGFLESIEMTV
ncbi:hypothetical protein ACHAXM_010554 [Skeletonema potamos]